MSDSNDVSSAAEKVLDFAEFYLTLGDLYGQDLLIAIGKRDPEFTYYIEAVKEPLDTITDFLRVYGDWAISQIRTKCAPVWDEVKNACVCSPKYQTLSKHWKDNTVLWDLLQEILGK